METCKYMVNGELVCSKIIHNTNTTNTTNTIEKFNIIGDSLLNFNTYDTDTANYMKPGDRLISSDGSYSLLYSYDGSLNIYKNKSINGNNNKNPYFGDIETLIKQIVPPTANPSLAILHANGDFVLYNTSQMPYWTTNTYDIKYIPIFRLIMQENIPNYRLTMQKDGNLVLYNGLSTVIWSSATAKVGYDYASYSCTSISC